MTSTDPPPWWCRYPGCAITGYCNEGECEIERARTTPDPHQAQRAQWRAALSEWHAAKRRSRTRRQPSQPGRAGYRIPPGGAA